MKRGRRHVPRGVLGLVLFVASVIGSLYIAPGMLARGLGVENPLMTVMSGSMWPELQRGDLVIIRRVDPTDIKIGDVIVFHHDTGLAVHRVVRIQGQSLTTRGDANSAEDDPITFEDVVGRVPIVAGGLAKIPFVGNAALQMNTGNQTASVDGAPPVTGNPFGLLRTFVASPLGFIMLILLPALLTFGPNIRALAVGRGPRSRRMRRQVELLSRMEGVWGEARAKRALRIH